MAGTVTMTEKAHSSVKKVTFNWTATTGEADKTTTKYYDGQVLRVVDMDNATTGKTYNLLINDSDGVDLLGTQGTGLTSTGAHDFGTSTGGTINWSPLSVVSGKLTLEVDAASTGSTGQTIVYIR